MSKLPVAINEDEFILLIKNTTKEKFKLAFLLGYAAGLRVSEVVRLRPEHINFNDKNMLIVQSKGKKDRVVPLPKGLKEKHLLIMPLKYSNVMVGSRALQFAFRTTAKRAGLLDKKPDLHFHSLRHGFAQNCLKKGMPLHYIQVLLGHSNVATTGIYLKANPIDALKSYEELF